MTILKELKIIETRLAEAKEKKDFPMIRLWERARDDLKRRFLSCGTMQGTQPNGKNRT